MKNSRPGLTVEQVVEARRVFHVEGSDTATGLAKKLGQDIPYMWKVLVGQQFKHVPMPTPDPEAPARRKLVASQRSVEAMQRNRKTYVKNSRGHAFRLTVEEQAELSRAFMEENLTNREASARFGITEKTANGYRAMAFEAAGLSDLEIQRRICRRKPARLIPELTSGMRSRFEKHVDKSGPVLAGRGTPCWLWTGKTNGVAHGDRPLVSINRQWLMASRVAWKIHTGLDPGDMDVLHHCDNPKCVAPDHLHLGTNRANITDKITRKRDGATRGAEHHFARKHGLTDARVMDYRRLHAAGLITGESMAEELGITSSGASHILTGGTWKHLPVVPDEPGAVENRRRLKEIRRQATIKSRILVEAGLSPVDRPTRLPGVEGA